MMSEQEKQQIIMIQLLNNNIKLLINDVIRLNTELDKLKNKEENA
jgi:hypothetical protein